MKFNSLIKPIKGVCIDCNDGIPKYLIAGRCKTHYSRYRNFINRQKRSRLYEDLSRSVDLARAENLNKYFEDAAGIISADPHCWECGNFIPEEFYRHATAHIFPKKKFPSVESNPCNMLVLAASCCHDKSHRLDTFSKMKVFGLAVKLFRGFENDIKESNKYLHTFKQLANEYEAKAHSR